nr:abnormal spindle-like microcephaly-associated protein homolog isoform X2 [Lepeophtheirus salmonis]
MAGNRRSEALYIERTSHDSRKIQMKDEKNPPETLAILAPFNPAPKIDFGELQLGKTRIRRFRCRNPSNKSISVSIENFPKDDKGFRMDFLGPFSLGPKEDAILSLGWAPSAKGAIREKATLKYAPFKTIIQMTGLCFDPQEEKPRRKVPFSQRTAKKNKDKGSGPTFQPPPHPVETQVGLSPPKVPMGEGNVADVCIRRREMNIEIPSREVLVPLGEGQEEHNSGNTTTTLTSSLQTCDEIKTETFYSSRNHQLGILKEKDVNHADTRRETFTINSTTPQVFSNGEQIPSFKDTFIVPAAPPQQRSTRSVLTEIKNVTSRLEESAINRVTKEEWNKNPSISQQDLLNDIQTDIICSPSRINHLQVHVANRDGYDLDLSSEDKENKPPRVRELFTHTKMSEENTVRENVNKDYESEIIYKEVVCTEEQILEEVIYTEEQIIEEVIYTEERIVEGVEYDFEIQVDGVTPLMDEIPMGYVPSSSKAVLIKGGTFETEEEDNMSQEYSEVDMSLSDKVYSEKDLADVSLMVAQHLQEKEEEQKMGMVNKLEDICISKEQVYLTPSEVNEGLKRFDFREESVYETNLNECKESFLHVTINEHNFMPIPPKVYCSTAVKDKTKADCLPLFSTDKASVLCKDLFAEEKHCSFVYDSHSLPDTVVGPKCQVDNKKSILETDEEECQISSETYTKSPDVSRLNTINEISEENDFDSKCTSKIFFEKSDPLNSASKLNHDEHLRGDGFVVFPHYETSALPSDSAISLTSSKEPKKEEIVHSKTLRNNPRTTTKQHQRISTFHKRSSPSKKESLLKQQSCNARNFKPTFKKNLTLIKMAAATSNKLSHDAASLIRHPNLYSANNIYYDERWIEKQEMGFTKWLNFIITPWNEIFNSTAPEKKIDAAKLWFACSETVGNHRAPTREVMSFRAYTAGKEMNNLRISACRLWQSSKVVNVITRLEIEIEKKRLYVRDDRCLNKDLGMKQGFLSLLLNYNPLWLRIGLETIYGEILHVTGNSDIIGISRFIITRLLSNPAISEEFIHPTVPHLYRPGYQEALKKFTLKKFLQIIYFLDYAKNNKLIKHNPCLFCKDADFKMSRDLLLDFSKKFLAGEGDVTKHLRYFGYDVSHKQSALDEFDFAVVNIPTDLRCGVRLCRVLEIILDKELTSKVRVPAISRLQKVHNVSIALEALKSSPVGLPDEISSKDIVNGHMEKTLNLIWHIIFGLKLKNILSIEKWDKEIVLLRKSLKVHALMNEVAVSGLKFVLRKEAEDIHFETDTTAKYVLMWCRLVCAHYGVEIENLSVSFSDGRALCFLIHHYYPSFLPKEEIMMNTTVSSVSLTNEAMSLDNARRINEDLLRNEKSNFKLFLEKVNGLGGVPILIRSLDMSNTIPDRKVTLTFLAYFAARLLDLSSEINAARIIQIAWRRRKALKEKQLHELQNSAAITIQRRVKLYLKNLLLSKYAAHALTIQRYYRGYTARKRVQYIQDHKKHIAALAIQSWWKMMTTRRQYSIVYKRICFIQSSVRRFIARKRYLRIIRCVRFIQEKWRGSNWTLKVRNEFIEKKTATIKLQRLYRVKLARQNFMNLKKATICIQSNWRTYLAKKQTLKMKHSILLIQTHWRGVRELKQYKRYRSSAIIIQRVFRNYIHYNKCQIEKEYRLKMIIKIQAFIKGKKARFQYEKLKKKTIVIQSLIRRYIARKELKELKIKSMTNKACIIIQSHIRGHLQRKKYKEMRTELRQIVIVQSLVRRFLAKQQFKRRKSQMEKIKSTVVIQSYVRGHLQRRKYKERITELRQIVIVQTLVRRFLAKQEFKRRKIQMEKIKSTIVIQSYVRGHIQRKKYKKLRTEIRKVVIVQSLVRQFLAKQEFKIRNNQMEKIKSTVVIQSYVRGHLQRKKYKKLRTEIRKIVLVQSLVRRFLAKKEFKRRKNQMEKIKSTVVIQSYVRGHIQRKKYKKLRTEIRKVVIVQSLVRQFLAKQEFKRRKNHMEKIKSTIIIQSHVRGHIQRKKYKKLRTEIRKIVLVQSLVRRFLAKQEFKRRKNQMEKIKSTIVIQSYVRGHLQRKKYNKLRTEIRKIVLVQSLVRRFLAKQEFKRRKNQMEKIKSTIVIQSYVRGHFQRRKYKERITELRQIVIVQTLVRRFLAKQEFKRRKNQMEKIKSTVVIQSYVRGHLQRKKYKKLRTEIRKIVLVQSLVRRFLSKQEFKRRKNQMEKIKSTIVIQSYVRGHLQRKKYKKLRTEIRKIVLVQSLVRQFLAKKEFKRRKIQMEKIKSTIVIQSYVRGHLQRRKYKEMITELRQIVIVQTLVRGFLAKQEFKRRKNQMEKIKSTVVIQSYVRGHIQRKKYKKLRTEIRKVVIVQSLVRQFLAKQEFKRRKNQMEKIKSTAVIQSYVRGHLQRKKYKKLRTEIRKIVLVQSLVRRFLAKKEFKRRKNHMEEIKSTIIIQSYVRGHLQRKKYKKIRTELRQIVLVQSLVRRFLAKQEFKRRKIQMEQIKSTIVIQSHVRGHLQRRKYKKLRTEIRKVVIVQSLVRQFLAKQEFKRRKIQMEKIKSTLVIQSYARCHLQRKKYKKLRTEIRKIVLVQSLVRRFLAKQEFKRRRIQIEKIKSTVVIQSYVRGHLHRRKYKEMRTEMRQIVIVQSLVRSFLAKQEFKRRKIQMEKIKSTIVIQSHVRGHLQRRKYKEMRTELRQIIMVQSLVRQFLAKQEFKRRKFQMEKIKSTVVIQSYVRGHLQRRNYKKLRTELRQIVIVQSFVRQFLAKQEFQRRKIQMENIKSRVVIQSYVISYFQRKKYMKLISELRQIVLVQSLVRRFLAKQEFKRRKIQMEKIKSTVVIQSFVRGHLQRRKYKEMRTELRQIVIVQSLVRRFLAKQEFKRQKIQIEKIKSSVVIQSYVRGHLQRRKYRKMRTEIRKVVIVQSLVRQFLAKQEFKRRKVQIEKNKSSIVIQSCVRGYLQKKKFKLMKDEIRMVIKVQSIVRRFLAMKKRQKLVVALDSISFTKQFKFKDDVNSAAICIQQNYRAWIYRKKFKKTIRCVIAIQSLWRGYRTRKSLISNTRLSEVRARLVCVNKEATENNKLCNRVSYVLCHLYNIKSLAVLIKIVNDLDASTRYSEFCCDQMLENGDKKPVIVLLDLILRCNKSVPHIEVISGVLDTLINLVRYERTRLYISGLKETYKTCLETLQRFEKSHVIIFAKVISFLYILTFEKAGVEGIKKQFSKKIKDYLMEYERKKHLLHKSVSKSKNVKGKRRIPHFPEWMGTKEFIRHFEDPICALKALLERLKCS